jgi:hypothetical protein
VLRFYNRLKIFGAWFRVQSIKPAPDARGAGKYLSWSDEVLELDEVRSRRAGRCRLGLRRRTKGPGELPLPAVSYVQTPGQHAHRT